MRRGIPPRSDYREGSSAHPRAVWRPPRRAGRSRSRLRPWALPALYRGCSGWAGASSSFPGWCCWGDSSSGAPTPPRWRPSSPSRWPGRPATLWRAPWTGPAAGILIVGAAAGTFAGTHFLRRLPDRALRVIFALFMVAGGVLPFEATGTAQRGDLDALAVAILLGWASSRGSWPGSSAWAGASSWSQPWSCSWVCPSRWRRDLAGGHHPHGSGGVGTELPGRRCRPPAGRLGGTDGGGVRLRRPR